MLNLNVQVGLNPLSKHKPIYFKNYQELDLPYSYTIGQDGQIVAWKKSADTSNGQYASDFQKLSIINPTYLPVYYMVPSLNGDHQKCVALIVSQLRLINQEEKTYKIITFHTDNRLRIWQTRDGTCINISSHNFFSQKVIGLCENTIPQSRFVFAFSQNSIFIVDSWTMSVIDKIEPKKQVYSQFLKGRINEKKQLQLYDNYHKSYKLDVSKLFKESFIDVGRTIVSLEKVERELKDIVESLHQEKLVLIHKIWKTEDYKTPLKDVLSSQNVLLKKESTLSSIFHPFLLQQFPQINDLFNQTAEITLENLFFIKGTELWYFVGTDEGKILGFPAVKDSREMYFMVKDESEYQEGRKNAVKYLSLVDNLLVCSWENGSFKVYTMDNLQYMIDQQVRKINRQQQEKPIFSTLSLISLCISKQKLSNPVKYTLPIYQLSSTPSVTSTKITTHETAFQLQNNEIIIFDSLHNRVSHFVGIEQKNKVYVVLYLGGSGEYVGIGTESGIEIYGLEGYERRVLYTEWDWKEWNLVGKFQCKSDYNSLKSMHGKGLELIQFANRHTINQIEYTSSLNSLFQETFGPIDTQNFSNELYSKFNFLQKSQVQKTLHSRSMQKFIAVLKHKHNSYRRDKSSNTSFLINCNLNRELDAYSTSVVNGEISKTIEQNFVFYSCFSWDLFEVPFLTKMMKNLSKSFVLNRRYVSQGIGKTVTLYFDIEECVFGLSKYILTEYAIAAIVIIFLMIQSFMQCYVLKEIDKADQLVSVVEYFTLNGRNSASIHISGQILSKSIISSNQNIVKACINLLISTIIAGHLDIHPLYEYFVLNLKNMEEDKELKAQSSISAPNSAPKSNSSTISAIFPSANSKQTTHNNKELTEIQCEWMLYLGLGLIYGKGTIEKQQIKMLLNRIIQCIEQVLEFIYRLQSFIKKPDLVQVVLKLLNQGLTQTWKQFMSKETVTKLYLDLFRIFFFYDGIGTISPDDKKFNFSFQNNSPQQIKRMKQSIIKTIVFLSKEFNSEFIQCLTTETVNQKPHQAYPASVIEILRQYLKSQKPTSYLVFYIELLLQCLSPMAPNLRKYVQKNVISTLQLMCTYKSVSFNQASQRLSIKSNNHLYIYCLRTSTKWRTISLLKEEGKEEIQGVRDEDCVLEMSPKGNYIALMTYKKLYIWRLSSGFWSGLLGAFSQRETFDLPKEGKNINIVWDQNENSITVVNEDPSLNKAFKV